MDSNLKNSINWLRNLFLKEWLLIFLVFFSSFLFAIFHLNNLPFFMYGWDDFQLIYQASKVSIPTLLFYIFLSPLQLFQGFLAIGVSQRSVHGLYLNVSYLLTGLDPSSYFVIRALFFALTAVLVYLFIKKITKNKIVSVASAFLYTSLPVIYYGVRWIGDAEVFSQFFLMLSLYLFLHRYDAQGYFKYMGTFLVIIAGVLSIKSRENGIILLPIFGAFLLLKWKEWKINRTWWIVVVVLFLYVLPALFSMYVLPTLLNKNADKDQVIVTSENILSNFKHILFYNPYTRIDGGEKVPGIFSFRQYVTTVPGSVLGSLGFFLAWYSIIMLGFFLFFFIRAKRKNPEEIKNILSVNNYSLILLLWFIFSALLMVFYVNPGDYSDIRYAGVAGLPFIMLSVSFSYQVTQYFKNISAQHVPRLSKVITPFFFTLIFISILVNIQFTSIYLRGGVGSRHMAMESISKTIAQDLYNQSFDNLLFFAITEHSGAGRYLPCIFSAHISPQNITVTDAYFLSFTRPINEGNISKILAEYSMVYVISFAKPSPVLDSYEGVRLVKEVIPCDRGYYCHVKDALKQILNISYLQEKYFSREATFFVHKIVREEPSFAKPMTILCEGLEGLPDS